MSSPFNAAADRNKEAIGDALADYFNKPVKVCEIGSGTGQHAIYLCDRFPALTWQPTDQGSHIETLSAACSQSTLENLLKPVELEVSACVRQPALLQALPEEHYPFVYSANTAHIMSMEDVTSMFTLVGKVLNEAGLYALYGPFKVDGEHTSEGNRNFDQSLRMEKPHMGIRNKEDLINLAAEQGLQLEKDIPMPANNRILLWRRMEVRRMEVKS